MTMKTCFKLCITSSALVLMACGGGSGSSSSGGGASPPVSQAPTYRVGVFEPSSTFKNKCEVVRTGTDSEGNPFPDQAGSTLEENHWLRSWSHETYLWNREITDQNPAGFTSPVSYFAQLKTFATTASGEAKDDFHFSQPTADFLEQRNNAASSGYGARFTAIRADQPRDFRVLYTEPNSPASEIVGGLVQFPRGAKILEVDGIDLVNSNDVDGLNDGLFPALAGEVHTFRIQDAGSSTTRVVTLTSEDIAPEPVNRTKIIDTANGKVAYMLFNTFSPFASEKSLIDAVNAISTQNVDDLVLDLRYNGGGLLDVAAQLGYMIAGDTQSAGKTFSLLQYNEDANGTNPTNSSNAQVQPIPFHNQTLGFGGLLTPGQPLSSLNLPRVFILSTGGTCSASEAVINALRGIDVEVILIGDKTCGKPYGFLPTSNCGETYYTIQFRGINDKGFGDYADGFVPQDNSFTFGERIPGCTVPDDLNNELGDVNEAKLSAALYYQANGVCPPSTIVPKISFKTDTSSKINSAFAIIPPEERPENAFFRNNMDITLPDGSRR